MDEIQQTRALPNDPAAPEPLPPLRRRGRKSATVLASAGAVIAVLAVAGGLHNRGDRPRGGPAPSPSTTSQPDVGRPVLTNFHWRSLPAAPIVARDSAVGVWTGTALLVWGGADSRGEKYFADGAAFDPATRNWTTLPASPLSARMNAAYVWTGTDLFVWGGSTGSDVKTDGAVYHPATKTWTKLPGSPVTSYGWAAAYSIGSTVVLLSTPTGQSAKSIDAASYDPATNSWSRLASVQLPKNHEVLKVDAVSTGDRIFVQSAWAHSVPIGSDGSREVHTGVDGYTFDSRNGTWSPNRVTAGHDLADQPLWTGQRVLLPAVDTWCGFCPGPMRMNRTGLSIDPASGTRTTIPHGPVDDLRATYLWTGSALLAVNSGTTMTGPGTRDYPGEAAEWNPTSGKWTRLPNAPAAGGAVTVWTGSSVIVWGVLDKPRGGHSPLTGIEFGPR